jgi:hypothetical protein
MNSFKNQLFSGSSKISLSPGLFFGLIILTALAAFEVFNYSTTEFALRDLLGEIRFAQIRWATILTIAFCGIDFAGIARLFSANQNNDKPKEIWYLFGAWLLAATMNAFLTWWGVAMAITNHTMQSSSLISASSLVEVVPIFVAIMVWIIRILIIGTISVAGDRLFAGSFKQSSDFTAQPQFRQNHGEAVGSTGLSPRASIVRPSTSTESASRPEPTYQGVSLSASGRSPLANRANSIRRM